MEIPISSSFLANAILAGNFNLANMLIERGTNINVQVENNQTPLMLAIRYNKSEIVDKLLNKGVDMNLRDINGNTALLIATANNDYKTIEKLINKGADLNNSNNDGNTALMQAIIDKNQNIAKYLINKGINLNTQNNNGRNALMLAVHNQLDSISKQLINKGCDLDIQDVVGYTALMHAVTTENNEMVKYILSKKSNLELKDKDGNVVIMLALMKGYDEIFFEIVDKNVDLNVQNEEGDTPLIYSIDTMNIDIARYIINKNVDLNMQNKKGSTALMVGVNNNSEIVVNLLLGKGVDLDIVDNKGITALMFAVLTNTNENIIKSLISAGADLNIQDVNGYSALMMSINNLYIFDILLSDKQINLNLKNIEGRTALMCAIISGNNVTSHKLITAGADLNIQDAKGYTALMFAVLGDNIEIVDELLNRSVKIHTLTAKGETAYSFALTRKNNSIIDKLVSKGASQQLVNTNRKKTAFYKDAIEAEKYFLSLYHDEVTINSVIKKYMDDKEVKEIRKKTYLTNSDKNDLILIYVYEQEKEKLDSTYAEADKYFYENYNKKQFDDIYKYHTKKSKKIVKIITDDSLADAYKTKLIIIELYKKLNKNKKLKFSKIQDYESLAVKIINKIDKYYEESMDYFKEQYKKSNFVTIDMYLKSLFYKYKNNKVIVDIEAKEGLDDNTRNMLKIIYLKLINESDSVDTNENISTLNKIIPFPIYIPFIYDSYEKERINKKYHEAVAYFAEYTDFDTIINALTLKYEDYMLDPKYYKENLIKLMELEKQDIAEKYENVYYEAIKYFNDKYGDDYLKKLFLLEERYADVLRLEPLSDRETIISLFDIDKDESLAITTMNKEIEEYFNKYPLDLDAKKKIYEETINEYMNNDYIIVSIPGSILSRQFKIKKFQSDKALLDIVIKYIIYLQENERSNYKYLNALEYLKTKYGDDFEKNLKLITQRYNYPTNKTKNYKKRLIDLATIVENETNAIDNVIKKIGEKPPTDLETKKKLYAPAIDKYIVDKTIRLWSSPYPYIDIKNFQMDDKLLDIITRYIIFLEENESGNKKYLDALDYLNTKYGDDYKSKLKILEKRYDTGVNKRETYKQRIIRLAELDKQESDAITKITKETNDYFDTHPVDFEDKKIIYKDVIEKYITEGSFTYKGFKIENFAMDKNALIKYIIYLQEIDQDNYKYLQAIQYFKNKYGQNYYNEIKRLEERYNTYKKMTHLRVIELQKIDYEENKYIDTLYDTAINWFKSVLKIPDEHINNYIRDKTKIYKNIIDHYKVNGLSADDLTIKFPTNNNELDIKIITGIIYKEEIENFGDIDNFNFLDKVLLAPDVVNLFGRYSNADIERLENTYEKQLNFILHNGISIADKNFEGKTTYKTFDKLLKKKGTVVWKKIKQYFLYTRIKEQEIIETNYETAMKYFEKNYPGDVPGTTPSAVDYINLIDTVNRSNKNVYERIRQLQTGYQWVLSRHRDGEFYPPEIKLKYFIYYYYLFDLEKRRETEWFGTMNVILTSSYIIGTYINKFINVISSIFVTTLTKRSPEVVDPETARINDILYRMEQNNIRMIADIGTGIEQRTITQYENLITAFNQAHTLQAENIQRLIGQNNDAHAASFAGHERAIQGLLTVMNGRIQRDNTAGNIRNAAGLAAITAQIMAINNKINTDIEKIHSINTPRLEFIENQLITSKGEIIKLIKDKDVEDINIRNILRDQIELVKYNTDQIMRIVTPLPSVQTSPLVPGIGEE